MFWSDADCTLSSEVERRIHLFGDALSMPFIPYEKFTLDSPLPAEVALGRLAAATGTRRWWHFGSPEHRFYGQVHLEAIRMQRAIAYHNSFLPRVRGTLRPLASGSRLEASLTMHPWVTAFMVLWIGGVVLLGLPMILIALFEGDLSDPLNLVPLLMLIFGWGLMTGGFTYESRRTKAELREILAPETSSSEQRRSA